MALTTPTLRTQRLLLRPFEAPDAAALFALQSDDVVTRYWDAPAWTDPSQAQRFLTYCARIAEEGGGARVAVDLLSGGTFIGWCSISDWNPTFRTATLGYSYAAASWGQGFATEAARALLSWAFDALDLNRVDADTDTRNIASARVLEKLGFVREGTRREDCIVNGEISDSWIFGLLRREFA